MSELKYICLSDGKTFYYEDELYICSDCGRKSCPNCGGDIQTIEEYDEAMKEMYNEDSADFNTANRPEI